MKKYSNHKIKSLAATNISHLYNCILIFPNLNSCFCPFIFIFLQISLSLFLSLSFVRMRSHSYNMISLSHSQLHKLLKPFALRKSREVSAQTYKNIILTYKFFPVFPEQVERSNQHVRHKCIWV